MQSIQGDLGTEAAEYVEDPVIPSLEPDNDNGGCVIHAHTSI